MTVSAAIYGLAGTALTNEERAFFRDADPWGYIVFQRNCQDPAQLRALTASLHDLAGRTVPILIDQEGGRVARLKPPHWRLPPPAAFFGSLWDEDNDVGREATYLNSRLIASELAALGINVSCAPCLDIPAEGGHDVIGDRAFSREPRTVVELGRAVAEGLIDGGVLPVIKHAPGHGRSRADSHEALPVVDDSLDDLSRIDFVPFRSLNNLPLAMTAHIVYTAIDAQRPATLSPKVIHTIIRGEMGFSGLLMSDDLGMKALTGTFAERARHALIAGCDIALHCSGNMDEMKDLAHGVKALEGEPAERAAAALAHLEAPAPFDAAQLLSRFETLVRERRIVEV